MQSGFKMYVLCDNKMNTQNDTQIGNAQKYVKVSQHKVSPHKFIRAYHYKVQE